jgi:hypothetical protein
MSTAAAAGCALVIELLADLRHYCDRADLDFAACDRAAYCRYCEEKGLTPEPPPATVSRRVREETRKLFR